MDTPRRFAEVQLGDPVEFDPALVDGDGWAERAQAGVAHWAGTAQAAVTRALGPGSFGGQLELSGCVYARHLDGSRAVDVRVLGVDARHGICAGAYVRVILA